MWYVPTVIKLEHISVSMVYNYLMENEIREVLFDLSKNIKLHKIDNDNFIFEIDYEVYVDKIMQLVESSACEQQ